MTLKRLSGIRRPSFEREGLVGEIGLILLGVCAVMVGLTAVFSMGLQKQNDLRSTRAYGKQVCQVLATAAAEPLAENDASALRTLVSSLAKRQGLVYAAVSDLSGRILAETNIADFDDDAPVDSPLVPGPRARARVIEGEDHEMVSISAPVIQGGQRLGLARVVVTRTGTPVQAVEFSRFVGIVALLSFLLVGAAYAYLRMVLRPLPKLIRELSHQIDDKTIRGIDSKGRGQLRDLIDKWNDAVRVFHEKIDDVDQSNSRLEIEKRVLEYEKKRVESIVNFLPIGVLVTNSSGEIVMANRSAQSLLQKPDTQLVGASVGSALDQQQIDEIVKQNRTTRTIELSLGGSSERVVKLTLANLSPAGREPVGSLVTIREITQQKMADRMTSEFVNHVAHEFKTPLASIRAYAEMLVDDQVEDERTRFEFYNTIGQETERLTRLIENLLNISRMEAGSLTASRVPVRVDKLMGETADGLKAQAEAKGIRFSVELPDPPPPMEMDKGLVSVALVNLIGNALKYTPEGGTVEVTSKVEGSALHVRVRDTGPGIQEEDLPHVFDKFYRSSSEDIQKQSGSGLGLALAQQIAFIHSGEITVTSEPGQGTEFCLALPVATGKQIPAEIGAES